LGKRDALYLLTLFMVKPLIEIGMRLSQLVRQLGLSVTATSQSVDRGKRVATEVNFELEEQKFKT
jgi:hypothetical protein